jgi:hypothetical protein
MARIDNSKTPSPEPLQTGEAELLACKNQLLSIQGSKAESAIEKTAQALRKLLKEIVQVYKSLKSDVPDYKIASLILLAETYFEMALLARQASNKNGSSNAYLEAQKCLTLAQVHETDAVEKGKVINRETIAKLNSRSFENPKAAEIALDNTLLDPLLLDTLTQSTHQAGPA